MDFDEDQIEKELLERAYISEESRYAIIDTLNLIIAFVDNFNGDPAYSARSIVDYCSMLLDKIDGT